MTVAELIAVLFQVPQDLPVLVTWEGTFNAVREVEVAHDLRIVEHSALGDRVTVGAVVIDGEHRVNQAR